MTYREILEESIRAMRIVANNGMPFSPASLHFYANWMEREMIENERRKPAIQAFWKCKHYPSAIDNFFRAEACEHGCHERQPTWDSNGVSV